MFLLGRGDLSGRLDPYFYQKKFLELAHFIESSPLPFASLHTQARRIFSGITPLSGGDAYTTAEAGVAFVRSGDFTEENTLDFTELNYIKPSIHQTLMKSSQLQRGDLLIAIVGATIGKVGLYLYDSPANINQAICAVRFGGQLLPEYVQAYLAAPIGQALLDRLKRPVARANINLEEIGSLQIPVLSIPKQQEVVSHLNHALARKQEQEQAAQALLAGLDGYLLGELGIELPKSTSGKMIFYAQSDDVVGNRIDPKKYSAPVIALAAAVAASPLPQKHLRDLITHLASGDWGGDEGDPKLGSAYRRCLVIRATEFDNLYNLRLTNGRVKYRMLDRFKLARLDMQPYDLLLEKSGGSPDQPVGRIALLTPDLFGEELAYSNFIQKFRVDFAQVLPAYLFNFLKTMHNIKLTDAMQSQTNGIRNLISQEYFGQTIILPEPAKQKAIAEHMAAVRTKAKALADQAQTDFAAAKAEIETLILA